MIRVAAVFTLSILSVLVEGQSFAAFNLAQADAPHIPRQGIGRGDIRNIRAKADDQKIQEKHFKRKRQAFHLAKSDEPYCHLEEIAPRHGIIREDIRNPRERIGTPELNNLRAGIDSLGILEAKKVPLKRHPRSVLAGTIIEDIKVFVESAKALFKFLSWSKEAQLTFDIVFETSECLEHVEDVIELMDDIANLVEHNAPEILYLEAIVENLRDVKDINKQISQSAKMMRTLGHLIRALSNPSPRPEDSIQSFKSLAHALIDIRNHRDITLDDTVIHHLEFSSKVLSDTASFLNKLQNSLHYFKKNCENNKRKDAVVYDTLADILDSLADLLHSLGFEDKVAAIKKQILFVKRITVGHHS